MASVNTVPSGNALLMVAVVPIPLALHSLLSAGNMLGNASAAAASGKADVASMASPVPGTAPHHDEKPSTSSSSSSSQTPPMTGLQGTLWDVVRRLQNSLTDDDYDTANSVFGIDKDGHIQLQLPSWSWPQLPWYATRDGVADALAQARQALPAVVGATACTAAIAYRQPRLGLRYAAGRLQSGLAPWIGSGIAGILSKPAALATAAGSVPLLLVALPSYYAYLALSEAARIALELGSDARQLATIVQMIVDRCEPVFRAADGLPVDVAMRVIALGLKQHLPGHVAAVVKQAVYVSSFTGNMSARLTKVLEAAAEWARGEQGRQMLDQLVRITEAESTTQSSKTPCAA
ncbi:hypothetical protein SYNPS1DRAFT_27208 [Syncephalis pseudoplumigaleata]|uniref:Uncharacterized protein n=1 Tax=Syncephalis pseudoplumigaleata TaxID=1712513 RepID=A0A4P9Z5P9_9FUNG|nr:hypothetical protein SYNPS1DRAFT_27208 [Syncephalis pseudoplumigaleata]|eukprot:RKP27131.1 hypothetical protein SYNPS1DRAFT_27208 [Syncephalis pseudoplumigaleata]